MFLNSPSLLQYKIANGYFKMPLNSNLFQGFLTLNYVDCTVYYSLSIISLFHCCFHNSLRYSSECQGHCTDVSEGPLNAATAANQICECFAIVLASPPSHPHTLTPSQPVVVVSEHGAGRSGCFCTVGVAHQLMMSSLHHPNCWEEESNIVDLVRCSTESCVIFWMDHMTSGDPRFA